MADDSKASFAALFARVQAGDQRAATDLVRQYEPQIRRIIRVRMTDAALRRAFDSADICQSVMGNFFVHVALGHFDLKSPAQLVQLLARMAANKLINQVERQHTRKRAIHRQHTSDAGELALAAADPTPSRIVAARELLAIVRNRLGTEERRITRWRLNGRTWAEIAAELNDTPDRIRVRHARAIERVIRSLGLDGVEYG